MGSVSLDGTAGDHDALTLDLGYLGRPLFGNVATLDDAAFTPLLPLSVRIIVLRPRHLAVG